jgi:hypothetical protein
MAADHVWSVSYCSWSSDKEMEPSTHQTQGRKGVVVKITMNYHYKGRVPKVMKHVDRFHCLIKSQTLSGQPTSISQKQSIYHLR